MLFIYYLVAVHAYKPLNYKEIHDRFRDIEKTCPFVTLTTGQEEFGMKSPENCEGCSHLIVKLGNQSQKDLPQIYFSGCLHGDERVGPVVLTELVDFICSEYSKNSWIQHIVDNHLIILTPTTNAQGYFRHKREETQGGKSIDPNRDFPFDTNKKCGESLTSQLVANIFNTHLIRAGITFHGGEASLSYPWGAYLHYKNSKSTEAPDNQTFVKISGALLDYSKADVEVGTMNDVVYPVHGSLEDWAYAGGFDKAGVSECGIKNFSNPEGLKQVFFLLEADKSKNPEATKYGLKSQIWQNSGGLIPQYIRMSLALIDLTEPYIKFYIRRSSSNLILSWEVWGCIDVQETYVYFSLTSNSDWQTWNKTQVQTGGGRWGNFTHFSQEFSFDSFYFVIVAKTDKWDHQEHPDPEVKPQTHMYRVRNEDYEVKHNGFSIKGKKITSTQVIDTDQLPTYHLKAVFESKLFEILDFGDKFEIKSEFEHETIFVYEFGDKIEGNSKSDLIEELCGKNRKFEGKVYNGCISPRVLAGRFLQVDGVGVALLESNPPFDSPDFGKCYGSHQNLTLEKYDGDFLLVRAEGDYETIYLEIFGKSVRLDKGNRAKFFEEKGAKVLGGKIKMIIDGKVKDQCTVRLSREFKQSYEYTHIKFPVWVVVIFVAFKVVFVSVILYKKCIQKKTLKAPKYEEIQLVFTNPNP